MTEPKKEAVAKGKGLSLDGWAVAVALLFEKSKNLERAH